MVKQLSPKQLMEVRFLQLLSILPPLAHRLEQGPYKPLANRNRMVRLHHGGFLRDVRQMVDGVIWGHEAAGSSPAIPI